MYMDFNMTNKTEHSVARNVFRGSPDCVAEFWELFLFILLIASTNGIVFALFFSRRKLRTSSNILLLSLAVSDFLNGALNCPLMIVYLCSNQQVAFLLAPLHNLSATSCALHILAITAEKFVAINKPLQHHAITKKTVRCVIVGIWLASFVIAFMPFTWYNERKEKKLVSLIKVIYAVFCLSVVFLVPCLFMMYGYVVMFRVINQRNSGRHQLLHHSDRRNSRVYRKVKSDRKCLIIFASMAAIFALCWFPYYVLMLYTDVLQLDTSPVPGKIPPEVVYQVFMYMRYLSSITNPLLYTFLKRDFWKAFKQITIKKWTCINSRVSLSETLRRGSDVMLLAFRGRSNILSEEDDTNLPSLVERELFSSEPPSETQYVSVV